MRVISYQMKQQQEQHANEIAKERNTKNKSTIQTRRAK